MEIFKRWVRFMGSLWRLRESIWALAAKDFKTKYLGSYLGVLWAFIQPVTYVFILWFVFHFGFRVRQIEGVPYLLWLLPAMSLWSFFSEGLLNATHSVTEHSYLVKKMVFRISVLPVVKLLSSLLVHLIFLGIVLAVFFLTGSLKGWGVLQIPYYLAGALYLLLGLSYLTSSLAVFSRDVGYLITVILNFGFWMTPVFWDVGRLSPKLQILMKLNPVFYLTEGYRSTLVHEAFFWSQPLWTMYFWLVSSVCFVLGVAVFGRLKPHFADVLY